MYTATENIFTPLLRDILVASIVRCLARDWKPARRGSQRGHGQFTRGISSEPIPQVRKQCEYISSSPVGRTRIEIKRSRH